MSLELAVVIINRIRKLFFFSKTKLQHDVLKISIIHIVKQHPIVEHAHTSEKIYTIYRCLTFSLVTRTLHRCVLGFLVASYILGKP